MARDEEKKTTGGRKKKDESEPKKGARARPSSAKSATATEPKSPPAARSAAKGTTRGASTKGDPTKPPTAKSASGRATRSTSKPATGRSKATEPTQRDYLELSHDEIAKRAHQVWRETGNEDALQNWIQAERDLRAARQNREE